MCRMCLNLFIHQLLFAEITPFFSLNVVVQSTPPPTTVADTSPTTTTSTSGKNQRNSDHARPLGDFQRIAGI